MPPPTLYKMCLERTADLLRSGVWEPCEPNPFSSLPSTVVQNLVDYMLPPRLPAYLHRHLIRRLNFDDFNLLLKSGLIKHLNFFEFRHVYKAVPLFQKLSFGCQNLQTLVLPGQGSSDKDASKALEALLRRCPQLEELHTPIYFDPNNLKNCKKLRTLKLHFNKGMVKKFSHRLSPEHLKCLESIEVFFVCGVNRTGSNVPYTCYEDERNDSFMKLTAMLLDNCPKLTSVGQHESSLALKHLLGGHSTDLSVSRRFQLQKCFWGMRIPQFTSRSREPSSQVKSLFPNLIRRAVLCFPLVDNLWMDVFHVDSLQPLTGLKNLVSLDIHFNVYADDYRPKFYSLLNDIGSNLKHLSIHDNRARLDYRHENMRLNLNVICDKCPNLESLQLPCDTTVDEPDKPGVNLLQLKYLYVCPHNSCSKSLLFLLSICVHLKILYLRRSEALEDGSLSTILQKNSLAELEEAHIENCSVSRRGLRRLIQSTQMLKKIHFHSSLLTDADVRGTVEESNPNVECSHMHNILFSYKGFKQFKLFWCP